MKRHCARSINKILKNGTSWHRSQAHCICPFLMERCCDPLCAKHSFVPENMMDVIRSKENKNLPRVVDKLFEFRKRVWGGEIKYVPFWTGLCLILRSLGLFFSLANLSLKSLPTFQVKELVEQQTKEWSEMVSRQIAEEHDMRRSQVLQQAELLKGLLETAQTTQCRDLEVKQDKWVPFVAVHWWG